MMTLNTNVLTGALIAIGMILGSYLISDSLNKHTYYNRSIHVKGLSEKDVIADSGTWKLTLSLAGDNINTLHEKVAEQKRIVLGALLKAGFKETEIKKEIPIIIEDRMLDRFNDHFDPSKQARYILESSIQVETQDVEKLFQSTKIINEFIAQGIILKGENVPKFFYGKVNEIKPEMLKEAGANAYAAALELANNTKSKIGKIKDARQGPISIRLHNDAEDYDNGNGKASPYLKVRVVINVTYFIAD